jgi:hypothetical protein
MTSFRSNDRNRFRPTVEEHANERCCNEAAQFPEVGLGSTAAVVARLMVRPVCPQLRNCPCSLRQLRLVPHSDTRARPAYAHRIGIRNRIVPWTVVR